jgi:hypothetical protein
MTTPGFEHRRIQQASELLAGSITIPLRSPRTAIILAEAAIRRRGVRRVTTLRRTLKVFFAELLNASPFHEVAKSRPYNVGFTSSGPLVYRFDP